MSIGIDVIIDNNRHGLPAHAFLQANGKRIYCGRDTRLCKLCKSEGVPVVAPDPHETAVQLLAAAADLRWREFDREYQDRRGLWLVAISDDSKTTLPLLFFGDDPSPEVRFAVGALVDSHNRQTGD